MSFYAFPNATYRMSLHGPGAEIEGTLPARRVRRRAPALRSARIKLRVHCEYLQDLMYIF